MAALNLTFLRDIYASLMYTDTMWVWRHDEVENTVVGNTDNLLPRLNNKDYAIYKEIPCRYSPNDYKDTPKDSNRANIPLDGMPELFWHPKYKIKAGDFVEIHRREENEVYTGFISEPQMYDSHYQTLLRTDRHA